MRAHKSRNSGFVLLMVLVVLVIATAVMTGSARLCSRKALEAARAQEDLQLRWGSRSCRDFFLPAAEGMLKEAETASKSPAVSTHRSIAFGGLEFEAIISDEQAKASINLMAVRKSKETLAAKLTALQAAKHEPLPILLRPKKPVGTPGAGLSLQDRRFYRMRRGQEPPMVYDSFDQVFVYDRPSQLINAETGECNVGDVTCWSDAKLNFKRADVATLRQALDGILGETEMQKLIAYREEKPDCTVGEALRKLGLTKRQLDLLASALTDASQCHSVWLVVQGKTRSWHRLYVAREADSRSKTPKRWVFEW
jgi:hypothetical protein